MLLTIYTYNSQHLPAGTDKPIIKLLSSHVKDEIAPKWRDLGIELLNEEQCTQLDIIEENHSQNVERCCTKMFQYWLRVDLQASWNKLIDSLEKIGENTLARKIKIDVLKGFLVFIAYIIIFGRFDGNTVWH